MAKFRYSKKYVEDELQCSTYLALQGKIQQALKCLWENSLYSHSEILKDFYKTLDHYFEYIKKQCFTIGYICAMEDKVKNFKDK